MNHLLSDVCSYLAVFVFTINIMFFGLIMPYVTILSTRHSHIICLLYAVWYVYDRSARFKADRVSIWFRSLSFWKHCANYFPINLIKTAELCDDKNYIIGVHPHGVVSYGLLTNFATNANNLATMFPGISFHVLSLDLHFWVPLLREIYLLLGCISANAASIDYIFSRNKSAKAIVISIGGKAEALDAVPKTMILTLNKRKGFIKMAIKHGASLVPAISFGENDVYQIKTHSSEHFVSKIRRFIRSFTSASFPIFYGNSRLLFFMPLRKQITTIVGEPIEVKCNANPDDSEISYYHQKYTESLVNLYNTHKNQFGYENIDISFK